MASCELEQIVISQMLQHLIPTYYQMNRCIAGEVQTCSNVKCPFDFQEVRSTLWGYPGHIFRQVLWTDFRLLCVCVCAFQWIMIIAVHGDGRRPITTGSTINHWGGGWSRFLRTDFFSDFLWSIFFSIRTTPSPQMINGWPLNMFWTTLRIF